MLFKILFNVILYVYCEIFALKSLLWTYDNLCCCQHWSKLIRVVQNLALSLRKNTIILKFWSWSKHMWYSEKKNKILNFSLVFQMSKIFLGIKISSSAFVLLFKVLHFYYIRKSSLKNCCCFVVFILSTWKNFNWRPWFQALTSHMAWHMFPKFTGQKFLFPIITFAMLGFASRFFIPNKTITRV